MSKSQNLKPVRSYSLNNSINRNVDITDDIVDDNTHIQQNIYEERPLWANYARNSCYRQTGYNEIETRLHAFAAISYIEDAIKFHNSTHINPLTNEDISNIVHWYFTLNNFNDVLYKERIRCYFKGYYKNQL